MKQTKERERETREEEWGDEAESEKKAQRQISSGDRTKHSNLGIGIAGDC